jgi:hypothetical protein
VVELSGTYPISILYLPIDLYLRVHWLEEFTCGEGKHIVVANNEVSVRFQAAVHSLQHCDLHCFVKAGQNITAKNEVELSGGKGS